VLDGQPMGEAVVYYGPFVMNTRQESQRHGRTFYSNNEWFSGNARLDLDALPARYFVKPGQAQARQVVSLNSWTADLWWPARSFLVGRPGASQARHGRSH
jgi:hypothetical protein